MGWLLKFAVHAVKRLLSLSFAAALHGERQRCNLAHELGHMVMDVQGDDKFCEKAAHRFAGAFLMPAEAPWSNVGRHRSSIGWSELLALKKVFGASVQAITYRCADLGTFPASLKEGLFREYSRLGFRTGPNYDRTDCRKKSRNASIAFATAHWLKMRSRKRKRLSC